jgi:hypothetical protein
METVIRTWRDRLSVLEAISWTGTVAVEMRQKFANMDIFSGRTLGHRRRMRDEDHETTIYFDSRARRDM